MFIFYTPWGMSVGCFSSSGEEKITKAWKLYCDMSDGCSDCGFNRFKGLSKVDLVLGAKKEISVASGFFLFLFNEEQI